jgi:stage II sporulation protein M
MLIRLQGEIVMNWTNFLKQIGLMKHYFIACCMVFGVGIVLGYGYSENFQLYLDTMMKTMERLAKEVMGRQNPQTSLLWLIFLNNIKAMVSIIVFGAFLGIMPLISLITNGLLLGYVISEQQSANSLVTLTKGIVPHGIIEIPALIFAAALGLRLGFLLVKWVGKLANPNRKTIAAGELKSFLHSLVPACVVLTVAVFVAAVLESTVTYWLLRS